jgi:nucleotide-binding universal stress UspA family protein
MGKGAGEGRPGVGDGSTRSTEARDPDAIRAEIDETRQELGETVSRLAEKTDVRAHVRHRAADLGDRAREIIRLARENPIPAIAVGVSLIGVLLGLRGGRR